MDRLKRGSAPISAEAWKEIDEAARDVVKNMLAARKVLKVNGPKGWEFNAVNEGRLTNVDTPKDMEVCSGVYSVQPLTEARVSFELSKWELDNIERGAKDPDLDNLETAVERLALFEEDAIYNGLEKGMIEGLIPAAEHNLSLAGDGNAVLQAIGEAKYALMNAYVEMPYDLIVSREVYDHINVIFEGEHLMKRIRALTGGEIYRAKRLEGALLLPHRDDDLEFTVGQDYAIGYEAETTQNVRLFASLSFTLRVLDPKKIVHFTLGEAEEKKTAKKA